MTNLERMTRQEIVNAHHLLRTVDWARNLCVVWDQQQGKSRELAKIKPETEKAFEKLQKSLHDFDFYKTRCSDE